MSERLVGVLCIVPVAVLSVFSCLLNLRPWYQDSPRGRIIGWLHDSGIWRSPTYSVLHSWNPRAPWYAKGDDDG